MKFLIIFASMIALSLGHSPVLLWPAEKFALAEGQSVLDMMNIDDFQKLFEGKKIIVFHKRTFNLEEVSHPREPLSYLQEVNAIGLQGVKSIHRFVGGLISSENLKFVKLSDANLKEQEEKIKNAMETNPGFAAVLVGSGSHRTRRAVEGDSVSCSRRGGENCMAYVEAVKEDGSLIKCEISCSNEGLNITFAGTTKLLVKNDANGYNISAEAPYKLDTETVWAPKNFSYSCAGLKMYAQQRDQYPTITLKRLQVYPKSGESFPESYDCATWFSSTLWMGTLVALFYIFILLGAVLYLLDVKTNDRFDDPKGKTITVNISE